MDDSFVIAHGPQVLVATHLHKGQLQLLSINIDIIAKEVLFLMPNDVALYIKAIKAGLLFNKREDWQQAMRAFSIAINEFPRQPEPYVGLAEACTGLKQYDKALDCYKRAARYSDGNIEYIKKVADMQERQGQLHAAGQTYLAAGEILLRNRELDAAIANWERAIRLEPNLLTAHKRLAMVFQRQGNIRAAVREYLAIARILEQLGDKEKAIYMCQAALRLDPDNEDVVKAIELIQRGAEYFDYAEEPEAPDVREQVADKEDELVQTLRHMASVFAADISAQTRSKSEPRVVDPVTQARRLADDELADEILRDEEDEAYRPTNGDMSKLQRDVYVGQAIDFQTRGHTAEAIESLEKAIGGGLRLAAGFFVLGLLYLEMGEVAKARRVLHVAALNDNYSEAVDLALYGD
jgi:tetratricopeptide (TPR) repeat protein